MGEALILCSQMHCMTLFLIHLHDPFWQKLDRKASGGGFYLMARHEKDHCFEETRTPFWEL